MTVTADFDDERVVLALRDASRQMSGSRVLHDVDATLDRIVAAAVDTVRGTLSGGISLVRHGVLTSCSPTDPTVARLDEVQNELGEGPCLTALDDPPEDGVILAGDLAGPDAARWPAFAPVAAGMGVRSIMSTQLFAGHEWWAALNLYAAGPDAFDAEARMTASLFGSQAALLLHGSERTDGLNRALATRDTIGQAKGILMERFRVDGDRAFRMLLQSSQDTNVKLIDVAHWLTGGVARDGPTSGEASGGAWE